MLDVRTYLPPTMRDRAMEFFTYGAEQLPLAVSARATVTTTIQSDADFVLLGITARVSDPAAVATVFTDPAILFQLVNTGNQQLQSIPVPLGAAASLSGLTAGGLAGVGGAIPVPYVFKAGGSIGTTLVNLSAAQAFDVRLAYYGLKVYGFAWNV